MVNGIRQFQRNSTATIGSLQGISSQWCLFPLPQISNFVLASLSLRAPSQNHSFLPGFYDIRATVLFLTYMG